MHEITKLVQTNTAMVANPMERPLMALVVVAKVRQKSHTELYFLFKYHSFSAFFCNFAAANKIGIYK